jgi:hypothetical protein
MAGITALLGIAPALLGIEQALAFLLPLSRALISGPLPARKTIVNPPSPPTTPPGEALTSATK